MGRLGVRNQARRGSPFASSTLSSRETLHLHVLPTLGCMNLGGLTPTHVGTLLANKAADVPGARSVQIIHVTLRTMLSEATRETPLVGLVDQRPRPKCKTETMDTGDQLVDDTGRTAYFVRGQQVIDRRGRVAYLIRHHHLINPDTGAAAFRLREQCVLDLDTGAVVYRVRASRALDLTSIVVSDPRPSDPSGRRVRFPSPSARP